MATVLAYKQTHSDRCVEAPASGLEDLIEAIGLEDFGARTLAFLDTAVGADLCDAYQMRNYELSKVPLGAEDGVSVPAGYLNTYDINRRFRHLGRSSARVEVYDLPAPQGAPFTSAVTPQGILIMGSRTDALYCVRILRTAARDRLCEDDLWQLREIADLMLSIVARHHDLSQAKPTAFTALTSLNRIQECILGTKSLSRREGEVCARILYGYSSCGIAVDLGIGKESVMTYRKRAYQHLGIGSQRELLMWYLEQAPGALNN
jgi:DNA-binding CsgD family transcriptional regulator